MNKKLINQHQSLAEVYGGLCIRLRELQRLAESGSAECRHCRQQQRFHVPDGRCDVAAHSQRFASTHAPTEAAVRRALGLLEDLREIEV